MKIVTGDNGRVAEKVCADLGMTSLGTLTGVEIEAMSDDELRDALRGRRSSPGSLPSTNRGSFAPSGRSVGTSGSSATE